MTPNEIIRRARAQFGEEVANSVQDVVFQEWVNSGFKELYNDLPSEELRPLITSGAVTLTAGEGAIPDAWDRVLDVRDTDGVPLLRQRQEIIRHIDSNQFFQPVQSVWALVDKTLLVRPTSVLSVEVTHQDPPANIVWPAGGDTEITFVNPRWHIAVVHLVTSYAYQQEEDHNSAAMWRNRYNQLVGQSQQPPPSEEQA